MDYNRTSNPVLQERAFEAERVSTELMTISGCVNKTAILLGLVALSAVFAWKTSYASPEGLMEKTMLFGIIAFVIAFITIFKPYIAKITAPLYAIFEGLFLGSISMSINKAYPGIAVQAITLTFGVFSAMLMAYKTQFIRVSEKFTMGLVAATVGIALVYLVSMLLSLSGHGFSFLHSSSNFSIAFSLFVVAIAALNLVLDFDFVVRQSRRGAPVELEWYAAFGLMVTLVWLYVEILRLLAKLNDRR
ncbi:MAG: Bax inhibitor-1/YccA family protein [Puniceicoccales bacterium]|jgi:uncharacterized YccA/Bax inhibitor family protein|nr:Bax inhibitor-1/YccA family protein [Puniceicoccales bacterium]